eukprot:TRINITY_DN2065_c0_g1_i1.p1 TRINITY_DN2065_c0_g1~~TRINITY_DN2065_c0_g1_i1.p1  ORF type:complete len:748 (+),score=105.84 TRINITY_DN2065_c0_g1_i1:69-2246(+)
MARMISPAPLRQTPSPPPQPPPVLPLYPLLAVVLALAAACSFAWALLPSGRRRSAAAAALEDTATVERVLGLLAAEARAAPPPGPPALQTDALPCPQSDFVVVRSAQLPSCNDTFVFRGKKKKSGMVKVASLPDAVLVPRAACGNHVEQMEMQRRVRKRTPSPRRFALCHFGLTRSVRHTLGALRANIYGSLAFQKIPFSVFFHTYDVTVAEPSRPGDPKDVIDWREDVRNMFDFEMFKSRYSPEDQPRATLQVDSQYAFDSAHDFGLSFELAQAGAAGKQGIGGRVTPVFRNLMRQLFSVKRVNALWQHHQSMANESFRAVIYVRQDLIWLTPLPPGVISHFSHWSGADRIYLPFWLTWACATGSDRLRLCRLNDRIALGTPGAMARYGNRMDFVVSLSNIHQKQWYSERLVSFALEHYSAPARTIAEAAQGTTSVGFAMRSAHAGGCLDIGVGTETAHGTAWTDKDLRDVGRNKIRSGAFGVRARAHQLYLGDGEGTALERHFFYRRRPHCGGLRASILASSKLLQQFVCKHSDLQLWCDEDCLSQAPNVSHWITHPPEDRGFFFPPRGQRWLDLVRVGARARNESDGQGGQRSCRLDRDLPYMHQAYTECVPLKTPGKAVTYRGMLRQAAPRRPAAAIPPHPYGLRLAGHPAPGAYALPSATSRKHRRRDRRLGSAGAAAAAGAGPAGGAAGRADADPEPHGRRRADRAPAGEGQQATRSSE